MVDSKSYCTDAKTQRDEASHVTNLSLGLTTCDTERLARAPRDEITACDQVPYSDTDTLTRCDLTQHSPPSIDIGLPCHSMTGARPNLDPT